VPGDRIVWAAAVCGGTVLAAEPLTIALLRRLAVLDVPGGRSSHSVPTPRGGGVPIAIGLVAAALIAPGTGDARPALAVAVGFFGLLGLLDDLRGLPALARLALQAAGASVVAAVLVWPLSLPAVEAVAVVAAVAVWLVGFVNAFNFMDGVNGISGAHALVGGACFAGLGLWRGDALLAGAGAAVAGGAAAFLPWNAARARVFLGDVGSYALGAALAVLAACAVVIAGLPPEAALGPLALYLADTGWTLQRRIRAGEPWLQAHRTHAYQRLTDAGWSHQRVTAVTGALTAGLSLLGAVSLTPSPLARAAADAAGLMLLAAYLRLPAWLGQPATAPASTARPATGAGSTVPVPWPVPGVPAPRPAVAGGELIGAEQPAVSGPAGGTA
jgi:UDP-GlcNAc:undecaprenyl-phosphate GlcNAc-1-phosphate transferase